MVKASWVSSQLAQRIPLLASAGNITFLRTHSWTDCFCVMSVTYERDNPDLATHHVWKDGSLLQLIVRNIVVGMTVAMRPQSYMHLTWLLCVDVLQSCGEAFERASVPMRRHRLITLRWRPRFLPKTRKDIFALEDLRSALSLWM